MHFHDLTLPSAFVALCWMLTISVVLRAMYIAPWKALYAVSERQHAYYAGLIALILLWHMNIDWVNGLSLHPLAITAFTVVFGWSLAIIAGFVAMLVWVVWTGSDFLLAGFNFIPTVIIPATITVLITDKVLSLNSKNLFIFLLGIGFFGAMLSQVVNICVLLATAYMTGQDALFKDLIDAIVIVAMVIYSEGFLNGLLVAAITVFLPDLVKTFDTKKYLGE